MNLDKKIEKDLLLFKDEKYLNFNKSLNVYSNNLKVIGVRVPIIRKYSSQLYKNYDFNYLINNIKDDTFEKIMLKGFLIGENNSIEFDEIIDLIDNHLINISDWSLCDSFCSSLKITKKYKEKMFIYIKEKLISDDEFVVRFALVMLINYYVEEEYLGDILLIISNINTEFYYIKMAAAWLLSYCLIYFYNVTYNFLINNSFDIFIYNKGIQKAIESRRISLDNKDKLRKIKNKVI